MSNEEPQDSPEQISLLIGRFERMLQKRENSFFDRDEFEQIFDFYFGENNIDKSGKVVEIALDLYPQNTGLLLRKAQIYASKSKFANALRILSDIEDLEKNNPDFFKTRGEVRSLMGMHKDAISDFLIMCSHSDELEEIYLRIAQEYQFINHSDQAISYLKKALRLSPDDDLIVYELHSLYMRERMNDQAIVFYEDFLEIHPFSNQIWFNLGLCYMNENRYDKSIEAFDYSLAIHPESVLSYLSKASVYLLLDKIETAIQIYEEALKYSYDPAQIYFFLGMAHQKNQNFLEAKNSFWECLKKDETFTEAWAEIGNCLYELNQFEKALKFYQKALNLDKKNPFYHALIADSYSELEEWSPALLYYQKSIELDPFDIETWLNYSDITAHVDNYLLADKRIDEALEYLPNEPALLYRKFVYNYHQEETDKAYEFLAMALMLDFDMVDEIYHYDEDLRSDVELATFINHFAPPEPSA